MRRTTEQQRTVLHMQRKKSKVSRGEKVNPALPGKAAAAASPPAQRHGSQSAAIALALDAIPKGEGGRFVIGGASGKGKTWFTIRFIKEMQRRRICTTAVIHDVKDPERPQYEGKLVHSVVEARRALVEETPDFIVCRPGMSGEDAAAQEG